MPLTTSVLYDDGVALLALSGELDVSVVGRVDAAVAQLVSDGLTLLVVDLSELAFCDSSGLAALLRGARRVHHAGGTCVVAGARGAVGRLLVLTKMQDVLRITSDVGTALRELREVAGGS